ncbi:MAG: peptidylprolyl isomerase, partial [Odoribacter sp.]
LGDQLYKPIQEEHRRYLMTGQKVKADSLIMAINKKIEKQFSDEKQFKMSPEVRGLYKSVGGAPFLDGDYTVFGEVIEGMDVIDQIAAVKVGPNDRPEKDVIILGTKLKRK